MSRCVTAAAVLGLLITAACAKAPEAAPVQTAAPPSPIDAPKLGERLKAARGTVAVVNVWATWCPPCVAEMPEFARFYRETNRSDVTFLSVSANAPETVAGELKPFVEKNRLPFPVYVLTDANPDTIGRATGADVSGALPLTLVYDRSGKLVKMLEEAVTFDSLTAAVKPLL